jgi:hypothetical protein
LDRDTKAAIRYHREQLTAQLGTINTMIEKANDSLIVILSDKPRPTLAKIMQGLTDIETIRLDLQLEISNAAAHYTCIMLLDDKERREKKNSDTTEEEAPTP